MNDSQVKVAKQKEMGRWIVPAMGYLLAVALGVLAWAAAPLVIQWVDATFPRFQLAGMTAIQMRGAFTAFVFVVMLSTVTMLVAFASRKPKSRQGIRGVTNNMLAKERQGMLQEKKDNRKRQRKMNLKMREYVKENQKDT